MVHGTHNAIADERNDKVLIYVNGDLVPRDQASISVFDSGYLIGDGIWEALRLHEGVLVFLDEHLDRLWQAAATVGMDLKDVSRLRFSLACLARYQVTGSHCIPLLTVYVRSLEPGSEADLRATIGSRDAQRNC